MSNIKEIISDYDQLKCDLILLLFSPLDEHQKEILKTFNDFDIDIKKLENISNNSNIIKLKNTISTISTKYNIHSIKDLENKIIELWDEHHFFDKDLIKVSLHWLNDNNSLGKIYIDMIKENLITNPNIAIGVSSEPIFTLLPEQEEYMEYNLKLLSEPTIDWNLLKNGTPVLENFVNKYNNAKNDTMKKYYHDVIMTGIKSNLCLFDNTYYHSRNSWNTKRDIGLSYLSLYPTSSSNYEVLKDPEFIKEIKEYLLSEEGLEHQLSLYKDNNEDIDKTIVYLKSNNK